jgi:RNA polymerase sigma factor (sigma-70 family)
MEGHGPTDEPQSEASPTATGLGRELDDLEQLVMRAKTGDRRALDRVIMALEPMVRHFAGQYRRFGDHDDRMQEGRIGVTDALETWDPTVAGAIHFKAFAKSHIRGKVSRFASYDASLVRLTNAEQKHFTGKASLAEREVLNARLNGQKSLDAPASSRDKTSLAEMLVDESSSVEDQMIDRCDMAAADVQWKEIRKTLTYEERVAFESNLLRGKRLRDVANDLQMHREQARQAQIRAAEKIKTAIGATWDPDEFNKGIRNGDSRARPNGRVSEPTKPPHECKFCKLDRLPGREVCEVHQWRRQKCGVMGCKERIPFHEACGRQYSYCKSHIEKRSRPRLCDVCGKLFTRPPPIPRPPPSADSTPKPPTPPTHTEHPHPPASNRPKSVPVCSKSCRTVRRKVLAIKAAPMLPLAIVAPAPVQAATAPTPKETTMARPVSPSAEPTPLETIAAEFAQAAAQFRQRVAAEKERVTREVALIAQLETQLEAGSATPAPVADSAA